MQKRVAVVTGASRGVGKGIALELCQAGFMVYITGRSAADKSYIQGKGTAIVCDHSDDQQVERMFAQISQEQNRIDVLVNNAWGGYENMVENGEFTWSRPFWQQPLPAMGCNVPGRRPCRLCGQPFSSAVHDSEE